MISLSLASIIYGGLKRESNLGSESIFVNEETVIGGTPTLERVGANSSFRAALSSLALDSASSAGGVLAFNGSGYSSSSSFCANDTTTFFSVFAPQAGPVQVATEGRAWVSGTWGNSVQVAAGWHEVMIVDGASCSITLPGGQVVNGPWSPFSSLASSLPVDGSPVGVSFVLYLPTDGNSHSLLLTSSGGLDKVAM